MKSGTPAETGATDTLCDSFAEIYSVRRYSVKPRFDWTRPVRETPSASVHWGLPSRQKVSTGHQMPEEDTTGLSGAGRQSERRSTDHRSRCGADQPGPAVGRCSARGDAPAIHDQYCVRRRIPGTHSVPCRPLTRPSMHLGTRGVWSTIRTIDKHTMTSHSGSLCL